MHFYLPIGVNILKHLSYLNFYGCYYISGQNNLVVENPFSFLFDLPVYFVFKYSFTII